MIVYGVADAGIVAVGNVALKFPLARIGVDIVTPLMVIETVSVVGGKFPFDEIVPESMIEGAPKVIDCDGVRFVNVDVAGAVTVRVAMVSNCWPLMVMVAALV